VEEESSSNENTQFNSDEIATYSPMSNRLLHLQEDTNDNESEIKKNENNSEDADDTDDADNINNEDKRTESNGVEKQEKHTLTSDERSDHTTSSSSTLSERLPSNTFDWDTLYSHVVKEQQTTTSIPSLTSPSVSISTSSASSQSQLPAQAPLHLRSRPHKRHQQSSRSVNLLENQSTRRKTKRRRTKRKSRLEEEDDFEIVPLDQPNINKHKRQRIC
jgi:hypothetical protein